MPAAYFFVYRYIYKDIKPKETARVTGNSIRYDFLKEQG